nr:hypothetical transcript [Hymenolepis microstoma]
MYTNGNDRNLQQEQRNQQRFVLPPMPPISSKADCRVVNSLSSGPIMTPVIQPSHSHRDLCRNPVPFKIFKKDWISLSLVFFEPSRNKL